MDEAYEPESYGEASVSAPNTATSSTEQSMHSATICARIVSHPVPISAAPIIRLNVPSSASLTVADPTSTFDIQEPCMAIATPAALTFPFPMSLTGYLSSQLNISLHLAIHLSRAHAFAVSP